MKELLEEQTASGFISRRYFDYVCERCISDPALAGFVSEVGPISECEFCNRIDSLGVTVGTLFHYMAECLRAELEDPLNCVGWDHGWDPFVPVLDSSEILDLVDEPLGNEVLYEEFVSAFDHSWCQAAPYRIEPAEKMVYSWKRFCRTVKTRKRYLIDRSPATSNSYDDDLLNVSRVLDEIGNYIVQAERQVLPRTAAVHIVRARVHDPSELLRSNGELGPPPPRAAQDNRMSAAGISMFYGAEAEATAILEVHGAENRSVTIGWWTPSREIVYLDLATAYPIPSIFDSTARSDRTAMRFLNAFGADLAQPIDGETASFEYVPTQIVTEYIRDHLKTGNDQSIDAIRYSSSIDNPEGVCWVVFFGYEDCVGSSREKPPLMTLDAESVRCYPPGALQR